MSYEHPYNEAREFIGYSAPSVVWNARHKETGRWLWRRNWRSKSTASKALNDASRYHDKEQWEIVELRPQPYEEPMGLRDYTGWKK